MVVLGVNGQAPKIPPANRCHASLIYHNTHPLTQDTAAATDPRIPLTFHYKEPDIDTAGTAELCPQTSPARVGLA